MATKRVLLVGLEPSLVDFTNLPHLNAEKVQAALDADVKALEGRGLDARLCLVGPRGDSGAGSARTKTGLV